MIITEQMSDALDAYREALKELRYLGNEGGARDIQAYVDMVENNMQCFHASHTKLMKILGICSKAKTTAPEGSDIRILIEEIIKISFPKRD